MSITCGIVSFSCHSKGSQGKAIGRYLPFGLRRKPRQNKNFVLHYALLVESLALTGVVPPPKPGDFQAKHARVFGLHYVRILATIVPITCLIVYWVTTSPLFLYLFEQYPTEECLFYGNKFLSLRCRVTGRHIRKCFRTVLN